MIFMPFIRLLAIYAAVGVVLYGVFNRDRLLSYFATPDATHSAPSIARSPKATPLAASNAPPAFGAEITPQYFGQAAAL